jgi:hypothetical protein
VEIFGWNFSASFYSSPERFALSSAAQVTAAQTVQGIKNFDSRRKDERRRVRHPSRVSRERVRILTFTEWQ